jgi:hypothetical protein
VSLSNREGTKWRKELKKEKNVGKKGKGEGIQNPLIYLKGERKVSLFSFLKVVDFYVF